MRKSQYKAGPDAILLNKQEAVRRWNLSGPMIDKIAIECKAKLKIGRSVRYDVRKMDEYILKMSE